MTDATHTDTGDAGDTPNVSPAVAAMADVELDDVVSRALAAIILERTADAIRDEGANAGAALTGLVDDTGLVIDVCAAILQATSWLAGTGGVTAEAVFAASIALDPTDEGDDQGDDAAAVHSALPIIEHVTQCACGQPSDVHAAWCPSNYPPAQLDNAEGTS